MSDREYQCRWLIVYGYAAWKIAQGIRPLNMIAYARALGLDV